MVHSTKKIQNILVILGVSFLSFCGDHRGGVSGYPYIAPGIQKQVPVVQPEQPAPVEEKKIYIFATQEAHNGDLARLDGVNNLARDGADSLCQMNLDPTLDQPLQVRALISIDALDQIRDMPVKYGLPIDQKIVGLKGDVVANDFADLLDGTILTALDLVSDELAADELYWTGSNADGTVAADTCAGFASSTGAAEVGTSSAVDATWSQFQVADCAALLRLICVAFE